jgi:hypothetical protein
MNSRRSGDKQPVSDRAETAERIAIDASRLARMAKINDFPLIAYLIDMAVLEAWREAEEHTSDSAAGETQPAHSS